MFFIYYQHFRFFYLNCTTKTYNIITNYLHNYSNSSLIPLFQYHSKLTIYQHSTPNIFNQHILTQSPRQTSKCPPPYFTRENSLSLYCWISFLVIAPSFQFFALLLLGLSHSFCLKGLLICLFPFSWVVDVFSSAFQNPLMLLVDGRHDIQIFCLYVVLSVINSRFVSNF